MISVSHGVAEQPAPLTMNGSFTATLLGTSPAMQEVHRLIERVGPTEASVLLTGESGSGKELAAQSIHECSPRRAGPFVAINCGAVPAAVIEAELFGVEKGSLHGAARVRAGAFERARGGTLFLDEVTELPPDMQARLLRVLETQKFYRVGATTSFTTDVRLIASTNRCPLQAVQSGRLREDLLYRLAVFPITLPPLRNRGDDVELLAAYFLAELNEQAQTQKRLSPPAGQCPRTQELHRARVHTRRRRAGSDTLDSRRRCARRRPGRRRRAAEHSRGIAHPRHGTFVDRSDPGLLQGQQAARGRRPGLQPQDAV
jgi:transcriptional regulator with PAS, ATPase and Fis domain